MLDPRTLAAYQALAGWMARRAATRPCPVIALTGAQGSGKSTAAAWLRQQLESAHGLHAEVLSLDDYYLPRAARRQLATTVHPLLATRGVPGTHDVALGMSTLQRLRSLAPGQHLRLPQFSKAEDERLPQAHWPQVSAAPDLVLFEGWCLGVPPQAPEELAEPVNALEAREDTDARWRRGVNQALRGPYAEWFAALDARVFLQVPDFDCVRRWRWQQEQDTARAAPAGAGVLMSQAQVERFIQHYERLSRHALRVLPAQADALLRLGEDHAVESLAFRGGQTAAGPPHRRGFPN